MVAKEPGFTQSGISGLSITRTLDEASRLQAPWANGLSDDLAIKDIDTTRRVVAELRKKLELNGERTST